MSKRVGLPTLIVTIGLIAATIYLWYNLMVLNTDYGDYNLYIRVLAVAVLAFAVLMTAGCYAAYMQFSQEDMERIEESYTKK
jgi:hypothetical protein